MFQQLPPAIVIEGVSPEIEGGRYPIKCTIDEQIAVSADIFKDGHDQLGAAVRLKEKGGDLWQWQFPLQRGINDRWTGYMSLPEERKRYLYTIEAWFDPMLTWLVAVQKKLQAQTPIHYGAEVLEGVILLRELADTVADSADREALQQFAGTLEGCREQTAQIAQVVSQAEFEALLRRHPLKRLLSYYDKELELVVDRPMAKFGAWYELFPRSQSPDPARAGTFRDCIQRLPYVREMGFQVLYLPPVHPIGAVNRKGKNNSLEAGPADPGSPWAIGSREGGHKSIHPELGTLEDFRALVQAAQEHDLEIALDLAFQCAPDHPYVSEHPEWFQHLPDGSIRYAENPPKKYQDIYPLDFHGAGASQLWEELYSVVLYWIAQGVRIFRVDNPHTKPLRFWEWLIPQVQQEYPETIFLAEAFTAPKVMKFLAKAGFTQSYTYFTWRNHKQELIEYLVELITSEMKHYFRPNFFVNTPDILPKVLQYNGKPAFKSRLVLAATLSPTYGVYSGYEFCENVPARPGSEEYLDSEKYEIKHRPLDRGDNLIDYIRLINRVRQENPALQDFTNLWFCHVDNDNLLAYCKRTADNQNVMLVVVNLNPHHYPEEGLLTVPLEQWGLEDWQTYRLDDQITGASYHWRGRTNYVRLDPHYEPVHLFRVVR